MALQREIEMDATGVYASYWRVQEVVINVEHRFAEIRLGGYRDKKARGEGKFPCHTLGFRLTSGDLTGYFNVEDLDKGNPFKQAYRWLKKHAPEFDGATDV